MKAKISIIAVIVAVLVLVGWFSTRIGSKPKEPTYLGRTLSEWISVLHSGYSGHSPHASSAEMEAAEKAIRVMGTNCIPILIEWMSKDYPKHLEVLHRNDASTAQQVFQILGKEARPAAPALVRLTKSKDEEVRLRALSCLVELGLDKDFLVPVLISLVHDHDKTVRSYAAMHLADLDTDAARKAGVYATYPQFPREAGTNDLRRK